MIKGIFTKVFGSRNQRLIKQKMKIVAQINVFSDEFEKLDDTALQAKTTAFRERLGKGESLNDILPEAFATVREASQRVLKMRHFDMQLIGAMILDEGKIAEMRTGEGKTLVATLSAYLNALPSKGVHVVTVNDYLAQRDAEWMGRLYSFLGLSTGVIIADLSPDQRREAYAADITYGTNNEFGFDYLRDNMAFSNDERVQRGLNFAIVDEVDSILIDEARTPLIISGPAEDSSELYRKINTIIPKLTRQERLPEKGEDDLPGDFGVDEKGKQVHLSDEGFEHIEKLLIEIGVLKEEESLYDNKNITLMHHVQAGLRAHTLFECNVDYIVKDKEVIIVDEFTGRSMPGRRWSEGLHQAMEAKEDVPIQNESQTLASITFQNYFRMYDKLSGMTGTADTEAFEFQQIYSLEVVVVPTHRDMIREDHGDLVYLTIEEKYEAIVTDIRDCSERGQPVLVGTVSIENSELIADELVKAKIPHNVLNAKFHEKEAEIVAGAGMKYAVTIATNMAGRGTDIVLGGNLKTELDALDNPSEAEMTAATADWKKRQDEVMALGGLHIIGTERHESRRIDNQLRGRSGRQGDAGSSRFYLSLEDSLMRIFASERVSGIMQKFGMERGEAIEHPWVSKAIENAQRKVEGRNFDMRKQVLEYDDVANDQRKVVYEQRSDIMSVDAVDDIIENIRHDVLNDLINQYIPPQSPDELWDIPNLEVEIEKEFLQKMPIQTWLDEDDLLHEETLRKKLVNDIHSAYTERENQLGSDNVRKFEKTVMLQILDHNWKDHLAAMDYLRQSIFLRSYAQKNPKQEYKREAFEMFQAMLDDFKKNVLQTVTHELFRASDQMETDLEAMQQQQQQQAGDMQFEHAQASAMDDAIAENLTPEQEAASIATQHQPFVRPQRKVGRNEPCPCGSGKKYKQCHGKLS